MSENSNERHTTLNRRDFLKVGGTAAVSVPAMSGMVTATAIGALTSPARAAAAGQCVLAVTQEAVNFNPLLYVNTGVETSVEYIVFDNLWKIDPAGKFVPNLATEIPTQQRRDFGGRPDLDDQAAPRRNLARRRAVHRGGCGLYARYPAQPEGDRSQSQWP
jgi:hypothetical protein